MHGGTVKFT